MAAPGSSSHTGVPPPPPPLSAVTPHAEQVAFVKKLMARAEELNWSKEPLSYETIYYGGDKTIECVFEHLAPRMGDGGRVFVLDKSDNGVFEVFIMGKEVSVLYRPLDLKEPQLCFRRTSHFFAACTERSFENKPKRLSTDNNIPLTERLKAFLRPQALLAFYEFEQHGVWGVRVNKSGIVFTFTENDSPNEPAVVGSAADVERFLSGQETRRQVNAVLTQMRQSSNPIFSSNHAAAERFIAAALKNADSPNPLTQARLAEMKAGVVAAAVELYGRSRSDRRAIEDDLDKLLEHRRDVPYAGARHGLLTTQQWGAACGRFFDSHEILKNRGPDVMIGYMGGDEAVQAKYEKSKKALNEALARNGLRPARRYAPY